MKQAWERVRDVFNEVVLLGLAVLALGVLGNGNKNMYNVYMTLQEGEIQ